MYLGGGGGGWDIFDGWFLNTPNKCQEQKSANFKDRQLAKYIKEPCR